MMQNPCHSHQRHAKLSCTPLQVIKKPLHLANYVKFANHFPFCTQENGTSKIYSELCKIRTICPPLLILVNFMPISQGSLHPVVKLPKFATSAHFAILANFVHFAQMEINPGWGELSKICTICLYTFI